MVHPSAQLSTWVERIPGAIEKAERLLAPIWAPGDDGGASDSLFFDGGAMTRTEVALARALLQLHEVFQVKQSGRIIASRPHPVLCAFAEKVEAL